MTARPKGALIIIGGHEQRSDGDAVILREVARRAKRKKGHLLVVTAATTLPDELAADYRAAFHALGVDHVRHLKVETREDAQEPSCVELVEQAGLLFFTGGDQLRITGLFGGSPVCQAMRKCYQDGLTIAGTSAGAAAMPETMIVSGPGDETTELSALGMAPGLGLIDGVVIDSHFAQRGRMGRLLNAVVQNPKNLGLGIDEDTAVVVEDGRLRAMGSGAIYVVEGDGMSYSSLSERGMGDVLTAFDLRLHLLAAGAGYDLEQRSPIKPSGD